MPLSKIPATYRGMKRLKHIAAVFIRHGFYDLVFKINIPGISSSISRLERESPHKSLSTAQRVRMVFEELGPTFIKLGQMLSLEPDIIPPDFVEEFKKLQDKVPPFPFEEVKMIIENEFDERPEKIFRYLNEKSIAAASISQVHYGDLVTGEKVAVKVQRPDIEDMIREDIKILRKSCRILEKNLSHIELLNPVAIVDEFENFITKELDFTNEAANIERFATNFKDEPKVCIPKVFWDFTSARVLVMEHLEGIEMDAPEKMREAGLDPTEVAQIGLNCFARQILDHGYFHADPHPGNSLAMLDGRVAIFDFGITGFIDQELMRHLANIFIGYAEHDYDRVITVLQSMDLLTEKTNFKSFKYDLMDLSEPFYGRSLDHIQIKDVFDKIITLAVKYQLRLPRELILLFKSLIGVESLGRTLSPGANILETLKPYAIKLLERTYDPNIMMGNIRHDLFNYASILKSTPDLAQKILKNVATGSQNLNLTLKVNRLEEIEQSYIRGSNRITIGLVTGTSVLGGAWVLASDNQRLPISIPSLGIQNLPITTLLGLIAFSMATILGAWLVFTALFRSK